jgi:hypothetical protein
MRQMLGRSDEDCDQNTKKGECQRYKFHFADKFGG